MIRQMVMRYTTRDPAAAAANEALIEKVSADLTATPLDGLRSYNVGVLEDGLSFVHVAVVDVDANPLLTLESFRAFSSTVSEHTDPPPVAITAEVFAHHP